MIVNTVSDSLCIWVWQQLLKYFFLMLLIINRLSVLRVPDIHPASSVAYTSILYSHIAFTIIKKKKKKITKGENVILFFHLYWFIPAV